MEVVRVQRELSWVQQHSQETWICGASCARAAAQLLAPDWVSGENRRKRLNKTEQRNSPKYLLKMKTKTTISLRGSPSHISGSLFPPPWVPQRRNAPCEEEARDKHQARIFRWTKPRRFTSTFTSFNVCDPRYRDEGLTEHPALCSLGWPPPYTGLTCHILKHTSLSSPETDAVFLLFFIYTPVTFPGGGYFSEEKCSSYSQFRLWDSWVHSASNTNCFSFEKKATVCLLILSQELFWRGNPWQSPSTFFSLSDRHVIKQTNHHQVKSFQELMMNY